MCTKIYSTYYSVRPMYVSFLVYILAQDLQLDQSWAWFHKH